MAVYSIRDLFKVCSEECRDYQANVFFQRALNDFEVLVKTCENQPKEQQLTCITQALQQLKNDCLKDCTEKQLRQLQYDAIVYEGITPRQRSYQRKMQDLLDQEADMQLALWANLAEAIREQQGYVPGYQGVYHDLLQTFTENYPQWLARGACQEQMINLVAQQYGLEEIPTHENFYEAQLSRCGTRDWGGLGKTEGTRAIWRTMKARLTQIHHNTFANIITTLVYHDQQLLANPEYAFSEGAWDSKYAMTNPAGDHIYTRTPYRDSNGDLFYEYDYNRDAIYSDDWLGTDNPATEDEGILYDRLTMADFFGLSVPTLLHTNSHVEEITAPYLHKSIDRMTLYYVDHRSTANDVFHELYQAYYEKVREWIDQNTAQYGLEWRNDAIFQLPTTYAFNYDWETIKELDRFFANLLKKTEA